MKQSIRTLSAIALAAASISGAISGCSDHHAQPAAKPDSLTGVAVIDAKKSSVPDWLEAVGTVRAAQTTQVASQIMGTILAIRAQEGDRVQAGQVLATIDDTQPRAAVQQSTAASIAAQREVEAADTEFALADATLKRYQQLFDKKSVSPQEFDEIKARCASAAARREMARAGQEQANAALAQTCTSLGYTLIRAPFTGVITEKKADVGTLAAPGVPIFTIEDTQRYRLEATVDERDIGLVRVGQPTSVALDAFGDAEFHARIAQIVPAADPASRAFVVKLELPPDPRLRSGLFGRARISRGERTALLIPQSALVQRGQLQGVYTIDVNREVHLAYVTLGRTVDQHVEVLAGVHDGDKLIAAPGDRDLAGKQVAMSR